MPRLLKTLTLVIILSGCQRTPEEAVGVMSVSIAIPMQPSSALAIIALEQGFFSEVALDVEVQHFISGKRAISDGLAQGATDYALAADTPFVDLCIQDSNYVAVASIYHSSNINRIVGRRDRGISDLDDLAGKHIGTQENSAVHFFLYSVLKHLQITDVRESYYPAADLPAALAAGEIDAFSMREPFISLAVKKLGENARVLSLPGIMTQNELLITRRDTLDPEVTERLLSALIKAEEFAEQNREQSYDIVNRVLNSDRQRIVSALSEVSLEVSLSQSLFANWERRERWMRSSNGGQSKIDFRQHIAKEPLNALSPFRVSVL